MTIFSSTSAAIREGFRVDDFDREHKLFIVVKDLSRGSLLMRMRALARPTAEEVAQRCPRSDVV